jgi:uncharacterized protein (TIGR00725 family)
LILSRRPVIAVIGSASCSREEAAAAEAVGRLLAEQNVYLVCGGGQGVMEAACRGARQAGGFTIGMLPTSDASSGNPYLSLCLPTGLGQARNALVVLAGECAIAVGGGYGTLSEIALALKAGRKVIGLKTWHLVAPSGQPAAVIEVRSPEEAVQAAVSQKKG